MIPDVRRLFHRPALFPHPGLSGRLFSPRRGLV